MAYFVIALLQISHADSVSVKKFKIEHYLVIKIFTVYSVSLFTSAGHSLETIKSNRNADLSSAPQTKVHKRACYEYARSKSHDLRQDLETCLTNVGVIQFRRNIVPHRMFIGLIIIGLCPFHNHSCALNHLESRHQVMHGVARGLNDVTLSKENPS